MGIRAALNILRGIDWRYHAQRIGQRVGLPLATRFAHSSRVTGNSKAAQLAFDWDEASHGASSPQIAPSAPSAKAGPQLSVAPMESATDIRERPARGGTALRARTAVLFSRLQEMGLRNVESLVLMRTRTVMVSLIGRTLRVNEGYAEAPESVLRAIVQFATARTRAGRATARDTILAYEIDRVPPRRREEKPRAGDEAIIVQLRAAHRELNKQWFGESLLPIAIRLSGRMATRLGHFDPGGRVIPSEIVMSRKHVTKHGWREAMHTLLHEMVHQWQHETGLPVDHGPNFRKKAREVGITPAARRDVTPLQRRRARGA